MVYAINKHFDGTDFLGEETREIPRNDFEKQTIIELMKGPTDPLLKPLLPEYTELRGFEIKGKVAIIDFDSSILKNPIQVV